MKKFTLLSVMLIAFSLLSTVMAQNLALNPSFEDWTVNGAGGPPDNYSVTSTSLTATQETTNVRTGTYSCNLTWTTTSTVQLEQYIAVTEGHNYTFSFWALDNDAGGRVRVAVRWYDASAAFISGFYGDYTADDPNWQQLSSGSQTAPAGAVEAHIEIRVYDISGWPGTATVYVDDVEFTEALTPEISSAYAISETAVDIQYSAAVSSVSASSYSLTGTASITFSGAAIDGSDNTLVHLTGASINMAGDNILDNLADAANSSNYDFYAGITPIAYTNAAYSGGTLDNTHAATFLGIISANDAYNNVWISDAAGAYNGVMIYSSSFDGQVSVGDEVLMLGEYSPYNDLNEIINPVLISTVSTGNSPYGPDVINGSDIDETVAANTNPGEQWEGQLVKIENFTVESYSAYDYRCSWSDGSNTYYFHVGDNVDYQLANITMGTGVTYGSITGVIDWYSSGPYYRINPRSQTDVEAGPAPARIVGTMNGWSTTDPDYVMSLNANGVYELTKSLDAGTHEYKVVEGDTWSDPNYPGSNQQIVLTGTTDITWKTNITAELVTHTLPVVAGNFMSAIGANDWDPSDLTGEMSDPEGDDIFTLVLTIPAGNYEAKVTFNHNWDQSTGGNVPFVTDGITPTTFTYEFATNTTTISGPPPPTAIITFTVNDATGQNYDGFGLKGSWDADGQYDPSWGGGAEHSAFFDDGTNGDAVAGDHIWTCQQELVVDGGSNTWEWGVNDSEGNWIAGNWTFQILTTDPQTLNWDVPTTPALIINEIMYNSPGTDEEWVEFYNNTDTPISLENWKLKDDDPAHVIQFPAGYSVPAFGYFTVEVATGGAFPFTPDYNGSGAYGFGNTTDKVRLYNADNILIDIVEYTDSSPWPTSPDGNGPTLSLIDPPLDNALPESWAASLQDGGTPGALNFPPIPFTTVVTPNGGEFIEQGATYEITWEHGFWTGDVEIYLLQDGQNPMLVVSPVSIEDGSYMWTVFSTQAIASDYKIQILPINPDDPSDESDDYFSIIEPYVAPELVFTEIMYNPPEAGTDSLEFLEIYNKGAEAVDLEGFYFSKGIDFTFPAMSIQPQEYLVLSVNAAAMTNTFGVATTQWTGGALSNGGEEIEITDDFGQVVAYVNYDDALPWDTLADGWGPSLSFCNPLLDNTVAENWTHSQHFAAINAAGDSIFATPGEGCEANAIYAGFEGTPTTVNLGQAVTFTDLSFGAITTWTWTFEGGTPDTYVGQTPPDILYNTEGTFDVTLEVTDGVTVDVLTMLDYITVVDLAVPVNLMATVGGNDDVTLTWDAPGTVGGFSDDFEGYDDFVLDFSPWTNLDVDGSTTYGMTGIDWPNAYSEQSFIIFNPSMTTPAVEDIIPHSGDKLAACFAATAPPNNDWMITPLTNIGSNYNLTFYAKSYTDQYGLERFRVGVSTTGMDPADFTIISAGDYVEAPVADWAEFTYDLSAYAGQNVFVGIQCVSYDAFILLVDDVTIGATKGQFAVNSNTAVVGRGTRSEGIATQPNALPAATTSRGVSAELLGYNVYRDDVMINGALVTETTYYDAMPAIGTHDYYVTAVYDLGESMPSNVVTILITDINNHQTTDVRLYPNPTDGQVTIDLGQTTQARVMVTDLTGKVVYSAELNGNAVMNLDQVESGLYVVQIVDLDTQKVDVLKLMVR